MFAAWGVVAALGLVDLIWARHSGLTFSGWPRIILAVAFLAAIGAVYGVTGRSARLADVGNYAALWVAFSVVGCIFTYVAATLRMPVVDGTLLRFDLALHFHRHVWVHFVDSHLISIVILAVAYDSLLPQIVGSILYFAHTGRTDRNAELIWSVMVSLIITALIAGLLPALGPYEETRPVFERTLIGIRGGAMTHFSLGSLQGIVAMPSFHAVLAILFLYSHRRPARSFVPVAILNALMVLSLPSEGHHYLADIIAGAAVAAVSIVLVRVMMRPRAGATLSA